LFCVKKYTIKSVVMQVVSYCMHGVHTHTHCFERSFYRFPLILYQVYDVFYGLPLNLPITETCAKHSCK